MRNGTFRIGLFLLFWVLYVVGCHTVYQPIKLDKPNTFMYGTSWYDTTISGVLVFHIPSTGTETNTDQWQTVWSIKATQKIPARGFVVTVGEIPEGFQQIIPNPPDRPVLLPGEHYAIHIAVKQWDMSLTRPTLWTAQ